LHEIDSQVVVSPLVHHEQSPIVRVSRREFERLPTTTLLINTHAVDNDVPMPSIIIGGLESIVLESREAPTILNFHTETIHGNVPN